MINGLSSDERAGIINKCLQKLHEINAIVPITADSAACNLTTLKKLGAFLDINNLQTFFYVLEKMSI